MNDWPISIQKVITGGTRTLHPTLVPQYYYYIPPPGKGLPHVKRRNAPYLFAVRGRLPPNPPPWRCCTPAAGCRQACSLAHTYKKSQGKGARCGVYENKMTQSSSIYSLYNNSAWHPFSSRTSAVRQLLPKLFKPCSKWSFLRMEPSAEFDEKFWVKIRQKWDLKGKGQPPQQAHRLWRPKNQPSGKWLYSNPEPIFCVFLLGEDLWDRISEFLEKKFPFLLKMDAAHCFTTCGTVRLYNWTTLSE